MRKKRPNRVLKSRTQNIRDLDDNLFLVRSNLEGLRTDPAFFKVLVASLRMLLCLSSDTEGLLWRVADDLEVSDELTFQGVGGYKPDHPQAVGLRLAVAPVAQLGEGPPGMPTIEWQLREYIKEAEGIFFAGKGITWERMIRIWSQQMGLSHESEDIDHVLAEMHHFPVSVQAFHQALVTITEFSLEIGERVLLEAETNHHYSRVSRPNHGDFTVFAILEELAQPIGEIPIFTMRCPTVDGTINCGVVPTGVQYTVRGRTGGFMETLPFPPSARAAIYAMRYSSNLRKVNFYMTDLLADEYEKHDVDCNIGWVEQSEVRPPIIRELPTEIVFCHGIFTHKNWLQNVDFRDLFKFRDIEVPNGRD